MDLFGIGPLELLLVLILGLLFLGPDKLPGMAAKAGQFYRNFKKAAFDLGKTVSEEIADEDKPVAAAANVTKDHPPEAAPKTLPSPASEEKVNE